VKRKKMNTKNSKKMISTTVFAAIIVLFAFAALPFSASASADEDYYVYWTYYPNYTGSCLGACGGYVDASGNEYIYFWDTTGTAYKVKVETAGDPQQHPAHSDLAHFGPVTTRTFTLISSHNCIGDMGVPFYVCDADEFHVDDSGIYLGPGTNGIHKWDHDWNYQGQIGPKLYLAQSLTYDSDTKTWYAGLAWSLTSAWPPGPGCSWDNSKRDIVALSDTNNDGNYMDENWVLAFTTPSYAGGHHDGMEYVKQYLWISDMTSDKLAQWHFGDHDNDPTTPDQWYEKNLFNYSHAAVVEGMGFGPNQHFWITGYCDTSIYEIGGGKVQEEIEDPWQEINRELDALIGNVSNATMPNIIKNRLVDKLVYAKELKDNAHEECLADNFVGATKKLRVAKNQVESFASMVKITRRISPADKASFLADATEIIGKIDRLIEHIETTDSC
jgi:hypothetical protein